MSKTLAGEHEKKTHYYFEDMNLFSFPVSSAFFPPYSIQEKVSSYIHRLYGGMRLEGRKLAGVAEFDFQEPGQMEELLFGHPIQQHGVTGCGELLG